MNENGDLILKNEEIAKTFNDYFGAIVDNLHLHHWEGQTFFFICNMKTKYRGIGNFSFRPVSVEEVKMIIRDLKTNKAVGSEIPTKILIECEFTFDVLLNV